MGTCQNVEESVLCTPLTEGLTDLIGREDKCPLVHPGQKPPGLLTSLCPSRLRETLPRGPAAETSPHSESISTSCPGTALGQWPFLPFPFKFLHEMLSSPPCSPCSLLHGYPPPPKVMGKPESPKTMYGDEKYHQIGRLR